MNTCNIKVINKPIKYQQGFSLLEVFVALAIGLVIFAGVLSIFVGMRTTTAETSSHGELQENGRFAMSLLTDNLSKQDFWGDYTGIFDNASIDHTLAAPDNDCVGGGVNNRSFPLSVGTFRTLWGQTVESANPMRCFSDAKIDSDVIQIKRVIGSESVDNAGVPLESGDIASVDNYYLVTNPNGGELFAGGEVPEVDNSRVWQYQHLVFYIREESQGNNVVPVLMQGRLVNGGMSFAPIVDGIEMIRFMYGVDFDNDIKSAGYGIVDSFISAEDMTEALWDNAGGSKIIAVKVYVLARNVLPDNKYTNTNTYQLGDLAVTFDDHYRRLLFSSTVTLYNARVDTW